MLLHLSILKFRPSANRSRHFTQVKAGVNLNLSEVLIEEMKLFLEH